MDVINILLIFVLYLPKSGRCDLPNRYFALHLNEDADHTNFIVQKFTYNDVKFTIFTNKFSHYTPIVYYDSVVVWSTIQDENQFFCFAIVNYDLFPNSLYYVIGTTRETIIDPLGETILRCPDLNQGLSDAYHNITTLRNNLRSSRNRQRDPNESQNQQGEPSSDTATDVQNTENSDSQALDLTTEDQQSQDQPVEESQESLSQDVETESQESQDQQEVEGLQEPGADTSEQEEEVQEPQTFVSDQQDNSEVSQVSEDSETSQSNLQNDQLETDGDTTPGSSEQQTGESSEQQAEESTEQRTTGSEESMGSENQHQNEMEGESGSGDSSEQQAEEPGELASSAPLTISEIEGMFVDDDTDDDMLLDDSVFQIAINDRPIRRYIMSADGVNITEGHMIYFDTLEAERRNASNRLLTDIIERFTLTLPLNSNRNLQGNPNESQNQQEEPSSDTATDVQNTEDSDSQALDLTATEDQQSQDQPVEESQENLSQDVVTESQESQTHSTDHTYTVSQDEQINETITNQNFNVSTSESQDVSNVFV